MKKSSKKDSYISDIYLGIVLTIIGLSLFANIITHNLITLSSFKSKLILFHCAIPLLGLIILTLIKFSKIRKTRIWRKSISVIINIVAIFFLIFVSFIGIEFVFKIMFSLPYDGVSFGHSYTWGIEAKNNKYGFRDAEFIVPKPNGTYRIMVLGDSLTWGVGIKNNERYTDRLSLMLNNISSKKIEVLNFGVSGSATTNEKDLLLNYVDIINPDLIIVGFCRNDPQPNKQDYSIEKKNYYPIFHLTNWLWMNNMRYTSRLLRQGIDHMFVKMKMYPSWQDALDRTYNENSYEWKEFDKALKDIKTISDSRNLSTPVFASLILGSTPIGLTNFTDPNEMTKLDFKWHHKAEDMANKSGYLTVNFEEDIILKLSNESLYVNYLDSHPSSNLNRVYAEKLFEVIKDKIIK